MKKTVVITGGAQGQGLSHALTFAKKGFNIVIGDRLDTCSDIVQEAVAKIKEEGGDALAVKCDVTKTDEVVLQTIDINLLGTWRVNKEAVKYMMKQNSGRIINISSTAGLKGTPNLCHYTMSKFGVLGLTKTLAKEVAKYGITVNALCPTMVKTPMTERPEFLKYINNMNGKNWESFEEANEELSQKRAMGVAFISPEDVSKMVDWIATSDEARLITGATLPLDAGSML